MTDPLKFPGWPEAFMPSMPGFGTAGAATPGADAAAAMQGGLTGGLDFIKTLWSNSVPGPAPGMIVPTVDVDELEKRIKDLKAVQGWLEINVNLLGATIQGLEVQRSTILALQSLSGSFGAAAGNVADLFKAATGGAAGFPGGGAPATGAAGAPAAAPASAAAGASAAPGGFMPSGWPAALFAMPVASPDTADADWGRPTRPDPFLSPAAGAAAAAATPGAPLPPLPPEVSAPSRSRARKGPVTPAGATGSDAVPQDALAAASAGWLGMMQEQFNKIAAAAVAAPAMSAVTPENPATGASATPARPAAAAKARSRSSAVRKKSSG